MMFIFVPMPIMTAAAAGSQRQACSSARRKNTQVSLENCVVIGDRWSDMAAASKTKSMKILVKTGAGIITLNEHSDKLKEIEIEYIAEDLRAAVEWLYLQQGTAIPT